MSRRCLAALVVAVAALGLLTSCSSSSGTKPAAILQSSSATGGWNGDYLNAPITLDSTALHAPFKATTGATTTLGTLQQGRLMLLYFGYTHCPDVCPTTMADLGTALRQLPSSEQAHVQVVFVTSDPAEDSTPVMHAWLSNFDNNLPLPFVGLTAPLKQTDKIATSVGVPLNPPVREPNGSISVEHGAQTLAFIDGKAHLLWTAGTSPADYVQDIEKLITKVSTA